MSNAGLRLTKFSRFSGNVDSGGRERVPVVVPTFEKDGEGASYASRQFRSAANLTVPSGYSDALERWQTVLAGLPGVKQQAVFTVSRRMIVGIGQASVLENSISLHRLWGTPIIPGSSLKGLAHHYATWQVSQGNLTREHVDALFGTTADSGLVTFHDAWYVPGGARDDKPLLMDVITGHHKDWYAGKDLQRDGYSGVTPPWDFTDPNPVSFISARGSYLVVVQEHPDLPSDHRGHWASFAAKVLAEALLHWGVGAKTNAGYGRLTTDGWEQLWSLQEQEAMARANKEEAERQEADENRQRVQDALAQIEDLSFRIERAESVKPWVNAWLTIPEVNLEERTRFAITVVQRLQERKPGVWYEVAVRAYGEYKPKEKKGKDAPATKPWFKPLLDWVDEHAPEVSKP